MCALSEIKEISPELPRIICHSHNKFYIHEQVLNEKISAFCVDTFFKIYTLPYCRLQLTKKLLAAS